MSSSSSGGHQATVAVRNEPLPSPQARGLRTSNSSTALLVIDVQESFRHRPYWNEADVPSFLQHLQALIDGAKARHIRIVQVFHVDDSGPFSLASGHVVPLAGVSLPQPDAVFYKRTHSALIGSGLDVWLVQHGIRRLIVSGLRTEQCCETTTRHASDSGYRVDYVTDATLTFPMIDRHGETWSAQTVKARTELVLEGRFARIVTVEEALAGA
jgi:nicotinamidase-related amidase